MADFYHLWLSLCFPAGSRKIRRILDEAGAKRFYEERPPLPFLSQADLARIAAVTEERVRDVMEKCSRLRIEILDYGDERYPRRLREIEDPPAVLYYRGQPGILQEPVVLGVVGTRSAYPYYENAVKNICASLGKVGVVIVSGCAPGIDTAAHLGAHRENGKTVMVMPCGLDVDYPSGSAGLKSDLLKGGGLIFSELPPGVRVSGFYFNARNRLIAALSDGVFVGQAPVRSGANLTARHAVEMGKELFCLPPHDIYDQGCLGVVPFLRDGAKPVFDATDILIGYLSKLGLNELPQQSAEQASCSVRQGMSEEKPSVRQSKEKRNSEAAAKSHTALSSLKTVFLPDTLTEKQRQVAERLQKAPQHVTEIMGSLSLSAPEVMAALTELELLGVAESHSGQRYALAKEE